MHPLAAMTVPSQVNWPSLSSIGILPVRVWRGQPETGWMPMLLLGVGNCSIGFPPVRRVARATGNTLEAYATLGVGK
jgi:hypothetical protein